MIAPTQSLALPPMRASAILAVIEGKRPLHPELARRLTFGGFRRIARAEGVAVLVAPHPRGAELVPVFNRWAIIVDADQSVVERTICALHELAHLWLHRDRFFDRHENIVYDRSPAWWTALEEAEADAFAELLIRGPASAKKPPRYAKTYAPRPRVLVPSSGECSACRIPFGVGTGHRQRAANGLVCVECAVWYADATE